MSDALVRAPIAPRIHQPGGEPSEEPRGAPGGPSGVLLVLTTVAAGPEAGALALALVEERFAACVHVLAPMTSVYRWRDRIEQDAEQQLVIKTTQGRLPALRTRLAELHPYQLPELIVVAIDDGSPAYLDWVRQQTAV